MSSVPALPAAWWSPTAARTETSCSACRDTGQTGNERGPAPRRQRLPGAGSAPGEVGSVWPCRPEGRGQIPPNHPVTSPTAALTSPASMPSSVPAALELLFRTRQGMGLHGGIVFPCIINGCRTQSCGQSQAGTEPGLEAPCSGGQGVSGAVGRQAGAGTHSHRWRAPGSWHLCKQRTGDEGRWTVMKVFLETRSNHKPQNHIYWRSVIPRKHKRKW